MSYNPSEDYPNGDLRNPSGIVFFGKDPSKPMLDSASNFLVDEDNLQLKVPNILLSTGNIGVVGNTNAINISSSLVTFATGVQIEGDLVVNGTTVTVNTETVTIDDNIIVLNNNAASTPTEDAGIEIERGNSNNVKIFWDESNDYWAISDVNLIEYELATRSGVQEFLNKTIDGNKNTLSNIANLSLTNSTIGIVAGNGLTGGGTPALGGSTTLNVGAGDGIAVANDSVSVTPGTGIVVNNQGVHVGSGVIAQQPFILGTGIVPDKDTLLILDSGVGLKQVTVNELIDGADLLTEFSISGANTTNVSTLSEGERLVFASGLTSSAGIVPVVSTDENGNPVVTLNVDESLIRSRQEANFNENDLLLFYDSDGAGLRSVTQQQLISDVTSSISGITGSGENPGIMSFWALSDGTPNDDDHVALVYNLTTLTMQGVSGVDVNVRGPYDEVKIGLEPTAVTTGTYGDANSVGSFTVDQNGRITGASSVDINIPTTQITNFAPDVESTVFTTGNFLDSSTIDFTVSGGTSVSGDVINNSISNAKLRDSSALSVIGRSANSTGDPADIAAASDHQVLRRSGTSLGFGAINLASSNAVAGDLPYSNLVQGSALSVLGVAGNATADLASIAAGTDGHVLRRSGTTLGFGQVVNAGIANDAVNGDKIADDSIDSEHYVDGSIDTQHLSDGSVTEIKRYRTIQVSSTSVVATGDIILCTGGSGGITITLPSVAFSATTTSSPSTSTTLPPSQDNLLGRIIRIKKIDSGVGQIIIDGYGEETIDGASTKRLYYENESMTLVAYPSANGWYII